MNGVMTPRISIEMKNCFDIIVAMDSDSGIGKGGGLPWHLPADLKHFKQVTTTTHSPFKKNAVIMGRKTWESLPGKFQPLPGRMNVVITRNKELVLAGGVLKGDSLDNVLNHLSGMTKEIENIFVIGGAQIFAEAIHHPSCRKIYVTQIFKKFNCDTFFPPFDSSWKRVFQSSTLNDQSLEYYFCEYVKAFSW